MKRINKSCLSFGALAFGLAAAILSTAVAYDLHVSPAGRDTNPGTEQEPFATINRARLAVRELKRTQKSDIAVGIHGGSYRHLETVVFSLPDSGTTSQRITYEAVGDGDVVFCSDVPLTGWHKVADGLETFPAEVRARLWAAPLPDGLAFPKYLYQDGRALPVAMSRGFIPGKTFRSWTGDDPKTDRMVENLHFKGFVFTRGKRHTWPASHFMRNMQHEWEAHDEANAHQYFTSFIGNVSFNDRGGIVLKNIGHKAINNVFVYDTKDPSAFSFLSIRGEPNDGSQVMSNLMVRAAGSKDDAPFFCKRQAHWLPPITMEKIEFRNNRIYWIDKATDPGCIEKMAGRHGVLSGVVYQPMSFYTVEDGHLSLDPSAPRICAGTCVRRAG